MFLVILNSLTFIRSWGGGGGCHSVPKGGAHETPVFFAKSDFVNFIIYEPYFLLCILQLPILWACQARMTCL